MVDRWGGHLLQRIATLGLLENTLVLFVADLDGSPALRQLVFAVSVIGQDVDSVETAAENLRNSINGHRGTVGADRVLALFVQEADDNYQYRQMNADERGARLQFPRPSYFLSR